MRGRWNFRGWGTFLRDEFLQEEEEGIIEEGSLKLNGAGKKFVLRNSFRIICFLRLWMNIYIDGINIMFTTKIEKEEDW